MESGLDIEWKQSQHTRWLGACLFGLILATLVGGSLLGLLGALIAIPTAATIQLLLEEVVVPRQNVH